MQHRQESTGGLTRACCRLFDRVLILQQGSIVYFGRNGEHATNFFCQEYEKASLQQIQLICSQT